MHLYQRNLQAHDLLHLYQWRNVSFLFWQTSHLSKFKNPILLKADSFSAVNLQFIIKLEDFYSENERIWLILFSKRVITIC